MLNKTKIYQILTFSFMCLSIILLLILGITAVQKSMKLNLAMKMSPSILCAIYINDSLVFNNKTSTIKSGVTLTANTLQLDSTSVFGQTFNLKIENLNEKAICITVSGCTIANNENYSTTLLAGGLTDNLAVNSAGTVSIAMSEAVTYQIAFDANGGSGTMDNQTHTCGISANLTANSYVAPEGKMFAGWARSADGEVVYEDGELILNATTISETITIYAVWEVPLPYTIYQYGDTAHGAVAAPDGWTGYSYIVFDNCTTYNGYPLRWIIIGAGTNNHSLVPTTVPTARVDSTASGAELSANEVLLLSEKTLFDDIIAEMWGSGLWGRTDLKTLLNGTFLTETGLSEYAVAKTLKTTLKSATSGDASTDQIFLLAYSGADSAQNYCVEAYLGTFTQGIASSNPRMFSFSGANSSSWWLRSGTATGSGSFVYNISSPSGDVSYTMLGYSTGVRPCFVLDLK